MNETERINYVAVRSVLPIRQYTKRRSAYLDAWFVEAPDDVAGIARALGDIARAKGMARSLVRQGSAERASTGR